MTGTVLQTFLKAPEAFTYVGWFMVLYIIASYIRLYPKKIFLSKRLCGGAFIVSLLLSWGSVTAGAWVYSRFGKEIYYYFVADSNKLLAVATAVSTFLFFRNLQMGYKIVEKLDSYGKEFLTRQTFEGEYANFEEPSDSNGFTMLNIDKIEADRNQQKQRRRGVVRLSLIREACSPTLPPGRKLRGCPKEGMRKVPEPWYWHPSSILFCQPPPFLIYLS